MIDIHTIIKEYGLGLHGNRFFGIKGVVKKWTFIHYNRNRRFSLKTGREQDVAPVVDVHSSMTCKAAGILPTGITNDKNITFIQ